MGTFMSGGGKGGATGQGLRNKKGDLVSRLMCGSKRGP